MGLTPTFFLCRYDRHCISLQSLYAREAPNHRSLQSELQDVQQVGAVSLTAFTAPPHTPPVSFGLSSPVAASPTSGRRQAAASAQARWRHSEHHPQDQVCGCIQTPAPQAQRQGEWSRHAVGGGILGPVRVKMCPSVRRRTLPPQRRPRGRLLYDSNNRQASSSSLSMCM